MALDSFFVCGNLSAYRSSVLPGSHLVRRLLFCLFWRNTLNNLGNLGNKVKHFAIKLKHLDGKSIEIKMTVIILEKYAGFWSHNHKELLFQIQKSPWVFQDDGKKKTLERNERRKWLHNSRRKKKVWVPRTEKHKWKCLQPGYSSKGKIILPHGTLKLDRQIIQHEDPEPEAMTATMRKETSWSKPPTEPPSSKRETSQTLLHGSNLVRPHGV